MITDLREQILQLAGHGCHDEEEKLRTDLLEKLNKCKRDPLIELCRSFDIMGSRANRKEELVSILMKFAKDHSSGIDDTNRAKKVKKRRHMKEDANSSSGRPLKKNKREGTELATKGEKEAAESKGVQDRTNYSECGLKDNRYVHTDNKKGKFPNEEANLEPFGVMNSSMSEILYGATPSEVSIPTNGQALMSTPSAKLFTTAEGGSTAVKASRKKNSSIAKKNATPKEDHKIKACGKPESRGDLKPRKQTLKPTRDELREAIFLILDTADFATMTFGDVVKKVDKHFGKDLFERKPLIRSLIEEELFRLAEEAEQKEFEEVEAAEAKVRAEQAAKERAKGRIVELGMDKANEPRAGKEGKTKNTSTIDKGIQVETSVEAADHRNNSYAVESSQDGKADAYTKDDNGEKVAPNVSGDDSAHGSGKGETVKNISVDSLQVSKDGKMGVGENDDTGDGSADVRRSGNRGNNREVVSGCEAEGSNNHENGERVECTGGSKAQEANNNGNSEIVAIPSDKDGKAKEGDINTEQSPTDSGGDGKAESADANTKADAHSSKNGSTENGKNDDDVKANSDSVA